MAGESKLDQLEEKSRHNQEKGVMSDEDAAKLDLVTLINRLEWRHTMNKLETSPKEARNRSSITLEGHESRGYALHLAVSKKPPVSFAADCDVLAEYLICCFRFSCLETRCRGPPEGISRWGQVSRGQMGTSAIARSVHFYCVSSSAEIFVGCI